MNPLGIRTVLLFVLALPLLGLAQRHTVVMHPILRSLRSGCDRCKQPMQNDAQAIVGERIAFLHGKGFLEATATPAIPVAILRCPFVVGRSYKWAQLTTRGVPAEIAK
ncbi:MAG: hypothetical protein IPH63_09235 [Flavobacteriales bacterium]|nr:hypothetical protein [Flavobacteriales bacterium]